MNWLIVLSLCRLVVVEVKSRKESLEGSAPEAQVGPKRPARDNVRFASPFGLYSWAVRQLYLPLGLLRQHPVKWGLNARDDYSQRLISATLEARPPSLSFWLPV